MKSHGKSGRFASENDCARRQYFVVPDLQGKILFRCAAYCIAATLLGCVVTSALVAGNASVVSATSLSFCLTIAFILPLIAIDCAKLTSRIFGPLVRVHGAVKRLIENEEVRPLDFRDEDHWTEWIYDFNAMLMRVQSRKQEVSSCVSRGSQGACE